LEGGQSIPSSASRPHHCHIDTRYLLALLLGEDWDRDVFASVHSLVTPPSHGEIEVSLVAVGEAFTKIAAENLQPRRSDRPPLERWLRMVREGALSICWGDHHDSRSDVLDLARQVRDRSPGVGPADCLIVATALACVSCTQLLTTDRRLLTNVNLRKFSEGRRRGLRASDSESVAGGGRE